MRDGRRDPRRRRARHRAGRAVRRRAARRPRASWTCRRRRRSMPCGDAGSCADFFEHGFAAARTCAAWTARASTRSCCTRRSGCSCRSSPSSTRRIGRRVPRVQRLDRRLLRDRPGPPGRRRRSCRSPTCALAVDAAARRRARPARRDGAPQPPLRPQPRRPAYDPLYDVLEEHRPRARRCTRASACAAPTIGRDRQRDVRHPPRLSHPMEQMAAMASLCSTARSNGTRACGSRSSSRAPGWLPYWLARLDGHAEWMRDTETAGLSLHAVGVLRPPVRDLHRPRRPAGGVDRRRRSAPTTWCGPATSRTPTPCTRTRSSSFLNESAEHGLDGAELDAVLWDTPVASTGWRTASARPEAGSRHGRHGRRHAHCGREAFPRHEWERAYDLLRAADADSRLGPEDLEQLAEGRVGLATTPTCSTRSNGPRSGSLTPGIGGAQRRVALRLRG